MQESIINYGMNSKPEFITCIHEEASVAMCHGYAKIAGKPMASMVHGVVGLQHSSMAIYNCFCDQAPALGHGGQCRQWHAGVVPASNGRIAHTTRASSSAIT